MIELWLMNIKIEIIKRKKKGLIELENEHEQSYKVLTSFHYMEDMVDSITITEEAEDEIPK